MDDNSVHSRFLSVLSHDVRGAFHGVQLALDMLARDVTDRQPVEQALEDVELGRRALIDATVRVERLIVAERLRMGVMPVRPQKGDIVPSIREAAQHAILASAEPAERLSIALPPQWILETDPRLVGEIVGGLLDHALRQSQETRLKISADPAAAVLSIESDGDWLSDESASTLCSPAEDPRDFDPAEVGVYVAAQCARALGAMVDVDPRHARVRFRD